MMQLRVWPRMRNFCKRGQGYGSCVRVDRDVELMSVNNVRVARGEELVSARTGMWNVCPCGQGYVNCIRVGNIRVDRG